MLLNDLPKYIECKKIYNIKKTNILFQSIYSNSKAVKNQSIYIPTAVLHRIENIGKDMVEFIEVQIGGYLGEDDIKRFEDDFGRAE